jgi:hypothetical protein
MNTNASNKLSTQFYLNDVRLPFARMQNTCTGVWISVSRHLQNWRVVRNIYLPNQKTTGQNNRKGQCEGKKPLVRLASELTFLLANPEFYSHKFWRVGEWLSAPLHVFFSKHELMLFNAQQRTTTVISAL